MIETRRGLASERGLDAFRLSDTARLYVEPLALMRGADAVAAIDAGLALALAGGPIAFAAARLWSREPGERGAPVEAPVPALTAWADRRVAAGDPRPVALLARLTGARPLFAGLAIGGASVRPRLMGVLNATPDSFSDGGSYADAAATVAAGEAMAAAGADIVDIGGESTRPGAAAVPAADEIARVLPVVAGLAGDGRVVSVDTRRAGVMRAVLAAGAEVVNDVNALRAADAPAAVAEAGAAVVLMHMQGDPATMQEAPHYTNVLLDVYDMLAARVDGCVAAGIARANICIDPGIGFGKTVAHNLALIGGLALFHGLGCAVALGASRKGFIGRLTGEDEPQARLPGSLAAALAAADRGVQILRVHDVAATAQALAVWAAIDTS